VFVGIIDDEPDLVNLFRDAINNLPGVRAFGFTDPELALTHFRCNQENYRCIISDYRMPSMTGLELFEKVKEINSNVTRILMSAFEIQDQVFKDCRFVHKFIQKPLRISNLVDEVQKSLNLVEIKKQSLE
jgi:DNA-binding NtrC family response regulator